MTTVVQSVYIPSNSTAIQKQVLCEWWQRHIFSSPYVGTTIVVVGTSPIGSVGGRVEGYNRLTVEHINGCLGQWGRDIGVKGLNGVDNIDEASGVLSRGLVLLTFKIRYTYI